MLAGAVIVGIVVLAWAIRVGQLLQAPREIEAETELDGDWFLAEAGQRSRKGL